MNRIFRSGLATAVLLLFLVGIPGLASAQSSFPPSVSAWVPFAPAPTAAMGHNYLTYELHLANFAPVDMTLARVDLYLDDETEPLASYQGDELAGMLLRPGGQAQEAGVLRAGAFEIIYLWVELEQSAQPSWLKHIITLSAGGTEATIDSSVEVRPLSDVSVLGPPLRGGPWVMAHGPANPNGHRRSYVPMHGRSAVVQRYAVDYFKVDPEGLTYSGEKMKTESYYAYGEDVLAVQDAVVAYVYDAVPEHEAPYAPTGRVAINLQTIAGNYVMLDIGQGRYAFYAHLIPGSIRVKQGDRVRKGQVIGLLGFSGNTPEPHLHLHIGDTVEPLGSEGLPYVFDEFDVVGDCPPFAGVWAWYESCTFSGADRRSNEIALAWKLIEFR